jgi:hypothetical protein
VSVPVVEIRPVGMSMHDGFVTVPVRVPRTGRRFGMLMRMMPVIVSVRVLVFENPVLVNVRVPLAGKQRDPAEHENSRHEDFDRQGFAES